MQKYQQADAICTEKQLQEEKCESADVAHIAFLLFLCNRYRYAT